MTTGKFTEHLR